MSVRSPQDLAALRRVGATVAAVLHGLKAHVRPGVTTAALDERCARLLKAHGARSGPQLVYGFPGSLCISVNDEAVHGVPGDRAIRTGDLVKLDLVAEQDGYFADAAITVAVPPVSALHRRLVTSARRAFHRALDVITAGRPVHAIGRAVERQVRRDGFRVIPQLAGHGVGRSVHEDPCVPNFADTRDGTLLTDGLVIAVEPIISAGSQFVVHANDGWTLKTTDGSASAHYEHTLVVTRDRPLVLTAGA
jgi:methionyl aminopeptidase